MHISLKSKTDEIKCKRIQYLWICKYIQEYVMEIKVTLQKNSIAMNSLFYTYTFFSTYNIKFGIVLYEM